MSCALIDDPTCPSRHTTLYLHPDKYLIVAATRDILTTTRRITEAVRGIPGLQIVGVPEVSVVAFDSDQFNIYSLSDAMKGRGWALNALQFPACVHLCVTRCCVY